MQLSREELLESYRVMRTIRDFEERVHEEFSKHLPPVFANTSATRTLSPAPIAVTDTA